MTLEAQQDGPPEIDRGLSVSTKLRCLRESWYRNPAFGNAKWERVLDSTRLLMDEVAFLVENRTLGTVQEAATSIRNELELILCNVMPRDVREQLEKSRTDMQELLQLIESNY